MAYSAVCLSSQTARQRVSRVLWQ